MKTGVIVGFEATRGSGIAFLVVKRQDGGIERVACDNGPTVRALEQAFGDVIRPGHTVDVTAVLDRTIQYETDDLGLLSWFEPVAE